MRSRMNINKRVLVESVIAAIVIIISVFGFNIVRGMLLTKNYVPDIIDSYASVEYLQTQVAFGTVTRVDWLTIVLGCVGLLLFVVMYYRLE